MGRPAPQFSDRVLRPAAVLAVGGLLSAKTLGALWPAGGADEAEAFAALGHNARARQHLRAGLPQGAAPGLSEASVASEWARVGAGGGAASQGAALASVVGVAALGVASVARQSRGARRAAKAVPQNRDVLEKTFKQEWGSMPTWTPPARGTGNLVHHNHTWKIYNKEDVVPAGATVSDCSVVPSASEYADGAIAKAWESKTVMSFDYRVVEVPQGRLLNPACDALIFGHLAPGSPERDAAMAKAQRRLVVIDETVHDHYGDQVRAYFEARGVEHEILVLPMVEENKDMDMVLKVAKKMKEFNIDRRTEPVLAIGGGVCLDVVGLASTLFRRRTPYIRVPTTCLSYVDASVGAKNGVNFAGSKNRLGTYVPPCASLLDPVFFATQQHREVANGMAEMAKMAIMKSPELYALLEENGPRLYADKFANRSEADTVPTRVLQLSIETMLEELAPNLWEHSLDRLVDFGHAVGQDLEMAALGTENELMHGESVACDMALMTVLAQELGLLTEAERDRTLNMLRGCQVPIWSPVMTYELFAEAVANRVKNSMGQRFPLPVGIGKGRIVNDVPEEALQRAWKRWETLCMSEVRELVAA